MNSSPADRYVVFGNPIAHSKSPQIHAAFAKQFGDHIDYQRAYVELGQFETSVDAFFEAGGQGANVTLPFKAQAAAYAANCSDRVALSGAANTLSLKDGAVVADNTDGVGLVRDIQANWGFDLARRRVLILGAGGAARGTVLPLLEADIGALHIANRSPQKALDIELNCADTRVSSGDLVDFPEAFDLIINASSAGLSGDAVALPAHTYHPESRCYDMVYASEDTPFEAWAKQQNLQARNGFGMLIEQAAESYAIWRGHRPDTSALLAKGP